MDTKITLDLLLCAFVFVFVLLPRFNKWPETEVGRFQGTPKDYIHHRLYCLYCAIYLTTFAAFTFSLSRVENINVLISEFSVGQSLEASIGAIHRILGEQSYSFFLLIVLGCLTIPQVSAIDQRWRGTLLLLARVPKDAVNLKRQLQESCRLSDFNNGRMDTVVENVSQLGQGRFWQQIVASEDVHGEKLLCRLLLKALYVASLNRTLDMGYQDLKDLDAHQSRLLEIAAVLPKLDTHPDSIPVHEYKKDIDERFSALLEQLAKNTVKAYPERDKRYTVLQQYGFYLDYVDEKKVGLVMPVLISAGSLLASCTLTIMVALLLFDTLGVSRRSGHWFELQRIFNWAFGGWISYSIAVAFGLFFNESMRRKLGQKSLALYFLAFVFATLGSCIFFILTRESFSPPHVWLAISFGLVSVVAIKSRDRDYLERQSVIKKALQLSLWYGLASAILQLMVHVEFRGLENTTLTNMIAFFLFGMVRGGMVAFVVAYIFMEYERLGSYDARRKFPRIPFRKKIDGDIGGNTTEVFVKDLSEQGALLRVAANVSVSEGESVALKFSFADIPGKIIAVKSHLARVKFTAEEPQIHQLQSFINKRVAVS